MNQYSRYDIALGRKHIPGVEAERADLDNPPDKTANARARRTIEFKKDNWPDVLKFINDPKCDMIHYCCQPGSSDDRPSLKIKTYNDEFYVKPGDFLTKVFFTSEELGRLRVHPKPEFPGPRLIREGSVQLCPLCGSSVIRKWPKFWEKKCINFRCESNTFRIE